MNIPSSCCQGLYSWLTLLLWLPNDGHISILDPAHTLLLNQLVPAHTFPTNTLQDVLYTGFVIRLANSFQGGVPESLQVPEHERTYVPVDCIPHLPKQRPIGTHDGFENLVDFIRSILV